MRGVSRVATTIAVVTVVVVVGAGVVFLAQPGGPSQSTTSSVSSASNSSLVRLDVRQAVTDHLSRISSRDIPTILQDYSNSSILIWAGSTGGQGGNYSGLGNIRILYAATLSYAQVISFKLTDLREISSSPIHESASFLMTVTGNSTVLGNFSGTVAGTITYQFTKFRWLIANETWNYVTFSVQNAGGATTFPQWKTVGGPVEETRSPNAFKQFVWDYGGAGTGIFVWAYVIALSVLLMRKRFLK